MKNENFISPTFGKVHIKKIVEQINEYIKDAPNYTYDVVVGSDSQNNSDHTHFVTAIIVHRKGAGGRFYWQRSSKKRVTVLRNRIYEEATISLDVAQKLMKLLKSNVSMPYNLEIHVDIGHRGKTKAFIQEIVGMIKGVGFNVKTKPESYAASTVADRYT